MLPLIARASLALVVSAGLLIVVFILMFPELVHNQSPASTWGARPLVLTGDDLTLHTGKARQSAAGELQVVALDEQDRAIATRRVSKAASDYPFVELTLEGLQEGTFVYLLWRTSESPEETHNTSVQVRGDRPTGLYLAPHPQWRGRITEVGLYIAGKLPEQPLVIVGLSLQPASWQQLLFTVWSQWTADRGWSQKSGNFLLGSTLEPIVAPTPAMALWMFSALLLLGLLDRLQKRRSAVAYPVVAFVPWLSLDLLWQAELSSQLDRSRYLFAGKSQHEKHLATRDADLYQYAQHLKQAVLPQPGSRIFLLHDSEAETYIRLRLQHYLLPHNLYNYDRLPVKKLLRNGEYLLLLGQIEGLALDPSTSVLRWEGRSLRVQLLDEHPQGSLYRVVGVKRR